MPNQRPKRVPRSRARDYAVAAQSIYDEGAALVSSSPQSAAILLINASIRAADAICVASRGEHWQGADHGGAVRFLATVDKEMATKLQKVIADKSKWDYGVEAPSKTTVSAMSRAAAALVERATTLVT